MASLKVKTVFCLLYAAVLFVSGILLIGFSIVFAYKLFYHSSFVPSGSVGPFCLLCSLGFFHLLLTWLAVRAPTRLYDCYFILFIIISGSLLVAEFAIGVWNVLLWDEVEVEVLLIMTDSFKTVINNDFNKNSDWNKLQKKMKCCGLNGIGDYKTTKGSFPVSCCEDQQGPNITCYDVSCRQPLSKYIKNIQMNGAIMSFLACSLQVFGLFIFYSFYKTFRETRSEKRAQQLEQAALNSTPSQSAIPNSPIYQNDANRRVSLSKSSSVDKGTSSRRKSKGMAPPAPVPVA